MMHGNPWRTQNIRRFRRDEIACKLLCPTCQAPTGARARSTDVKPKQRNKEPMRFVRQPARHLRLWRLRSALRDKLRSLHLTCQLGQWLSRKPGSKP
jgi:hypothetical protein